MQIEDHPVDPPEGGIAGHHADVIHRVGVAGDGHAVLVVWIGPLGTAHQRERISLRGSEALDRRRALNRRRSHQATERSQPPPRAPNCSAELRSELVELVEACPDRGRWKRRRVEHKL